MGVRLSWAVLPYDAALAAPLPTARGAIARRRGWYVACRGGGRIGLGEVTPWPAWGTETEAAAERALAALPSGVEAPETLDDVRACLTALGLASGGAAVWAGLEAALLDWLARRFGQPLATLLREGPGESARQVAVAALIGAEPPELAAARAAAAVAAGHRTVKLKLVGEQDLARARAVRAAVGAAVALRLDANALWPDADVALPDLLPFAEVAPEFFEQPLPAHDLAGLAALSRRLPFPLAADEALGTAGAFDAAIAAGVPVLVCKPMVHGGLLAARDLIERARAAGLRVVLSSSLDRGLGSAGVLHLAAAFAQETGCAGLGTVGLYADGGALAGLTPQDGCLPLPAGPGLGLSPAVPVLRDWLAGLDQLTGGHAT